MTTQQKLQQEQLEHLESTPLPPGAWLSLATEIYLAIFSFLRVADCVSLGNVCHLFHTIAEDNVIWKRLSARDFARELNDEPKRVTVKAWYNKYKENFGTKKNWRTGHCRVNQLLGHAKGVRSLQFDHDLLLSSSYDKSMRIWNLQTGQCLRAMTGHTEPVLCARFRDGVIASASADSRIKLWDMESGAMQMTLCGHQGPVVTLQHAAPNLVLSGGSDSSLKFWDMRIGAWIANLVGHRAEIDCLQVDSYKAVSGDSAGQLIWWDTRVGTVMHSIPHAHNKIIWGLQFNDEILATAGVDKTVKLWNVHTFERLPPLRTGSGILCMQFDDQRLITGTSDCALRMFDMRGSGLVANVTGPVSTRAPLCLQFNERRLVTGSFDKAILVRDFTPESGHEN